MIRYDRPQIALAVALSLLAGYVDGIGFLQLGGFFVSFMSGNSTRLAVGLSGVSRAQALIAGSILATFISGVVLGSLLAHAAGRWRRIAVLGAETLLLGFAALAQTLGEPVVAVGGMILAMAVENTLFQRGGEVSVGLTYMTGCLVKMGQNIAAALLGGPRWAWLRYFLLWAGLLTGGVAGALSYQYIGLAALWIAVGYASTVFLAVCLRRGLSEHEETGPGAPQPQTP